MIGAFSGAFSNSSYIIPNPRERLPLKSVGEALRDTSKQVIGNRKLLGRGEEIPLQPVRPVMSVSSVERPALAEPTRREGADPAEVAARMRIQPYEDPNQDVSAVQKSEEDNQPDNDLKVGPESAQEAIEEGECQTCEKRKYQDESDDMGVSFQAPTNIAPEQVAAAVRGHENEHVVREQAKAQMEDRKVVSQSVTLHTDICPECGKVYISGGTTRTVTKADNKAEQAKLAMEAEEENKKKSPGSVFA